MHIHNQSTREHSLTQCYAPNIITFGRVEAKTEIQNQGSLIMDHYKMYLKGRLMAPKILNWMSCLNKLCKYGGNSNKNLKSSVFLYIILCSPLKTNQRFGRIHHVCLRVEE